MYRSLEVTLLSAKGIKRVKQISKMDVYVVATVSGDSRSVQKTPVHKDSGSKPTWNFTMKFTVDESLAQSDNLMLILLLRCFRHLHSDMDIGEVDVSIKGLLDHAGDDMSAKYVTYDVKRPSGKPKGKLNFSFKFGERVAGATQSPVTAYPMHTVYCAPCASPAAVPHPTTVMGCYPPAGYPLAGFPDTSYGYHPNFDSSPPRPPPGYPPIGSENGCSVIYIYTVG